MTTYSRELRDILQSSEQKSSMEVSAQPYAFSFCLHCATLVSTKPSVSDGFSHGQG